MLVASHLQMKAANLPYDLSKSYERWSSPMSAIDQMNELLLRSYVSRHLSGLAWRMFLPGIKQCRIAQDMRGDASLLSCRPGSSLPAHTHEGLEAVLVLQGGFSDAIGHYGPGDIAVSDGTIDHRPVADRLTECIIFVVLEAPVKLTGHSAASSRGCTAAIVGFSAGSQHGPPHCANVYRERPICQRTIT